MIRTVIVEDSRPVAHALRELLERDGEFDVAAVATSLQQSAEVISAFHPRLVITDFQLPDGDACDHFPMWRRLARDLVIIVISGWTDDRTRRRSLDAGAGAFVPKGNELFDLPTIARRLVDSPASVASDVPTTPVPVLLDADDLRLLDMLAVGTDTASIARALPATQVEVRQSVVRLANEFGVRSRRAVVDAARVRGLIKVET